MLIRVDGYHISTCHVSMLGRRLQRSGRSWGQWLATCGVELQWRDAQGFGWTCLESTLSHGAQMQCFPAWPTPQTWEREREFEGLEAVELAYCQLFSLRIIGGYWWIVSCPFPRMILRKFVLVPTPLQAMELWTCKTLREIEPWHAFPVTAPLLPKHCHDASVGLIAIGPPRFKDFQVPATPAKLEETFARAFDIFGHLLKLLTIYTFLDLLISGSYTLTCERTERLSCDTIGSLHTHLMQWPQRNWRTGSLILVPPHTWMFTKTSHWCGQGVKLGKTCCSHMPYAKCIETYWN